MPTTFIIRRMLHVLEEGRREKGGEKAESGMGRLTNRMYFSVVFNLSSLHSGKHSFLASSLLAHRDATRHDTTRHDPDNHEPM